MEELGSHFDIKRLIEFVKDDNNKILLQAGTLRNVLRFTAGQSNPTFRLDFTNASFVLRMKPKGTLLPGAHQIDREFKVMTKLFAAEFPVPEPICYCSDTMYLGTEFYIMKYVQGRVFNDMGLAKVSAEERGKMYLELTRVLSKLHLLDPEKIGVAALSKKNNKSYLERQLRTWFRNYKESFIQEERDATDAVMDVTHDWLMVHLPQETKTCLVHGDYKLDNVIWHPHKAEILAVVDWEIVTIGDPLADLAYCFQAFNIGAANDGSQFNLTGSPFSSGALIAGIPPLDFLLWQYHLFMNLPFPNPFMEYYHIYAQFRVACIIRGIQGRFHRGNAASTSASRFTNEIVFLFARRSLDLAIQRDPSNSRLKSLPITWNESIVSVDTVSLPHPMSDYATSLMRELLAFMDKYIYPNEVLYEAQMKQFTDEGNRWQIPPIVEHLKAVAKKETRLWNVWMSKWSRVTQAEYSRLAEIMGRNLWAAEIFNCQFPDTGNMETLEIFATPEQKLKWLEPLKDGSIRSGTFLLAFKKSHLIFVQAFLMTEIQVPSSDALQISTSIVKKSDSDYLINGSKYWITNGGDPRLKVLLLLGKTGGFTDDPHRRHSVVIVPADSPGVIFKAPMTVFGYDDAPQGHFEVEFVNVQVPCTNLLHIEGAGFEIAQTRLGPGRIHHCMRTIGLAERSLELMMDRVLSRKAFGDVVGKMGTIRQDIANMRIAIDETRLLTIAAAHALDTLGGKNARKAIAEIKVAAPLMALQVIDKAMQAHGGVGLSHQFPLASWYARTRTVRYMDGPDEVHRETIAKLELRERETAKL